MDDLNTAEQAVDRMTEILGMRDRDLAWRVEQNGRCLDQQLPLGDSAPLLLLPHSGLPGGKGGFGSLLRAIGAQIEATTNHEAMRDLSGRRQRDVNNEQRLKKYVEGAADRERLEQEKKEAKMEKLRKVAQGEIHNRDKHSFSDPAYDKARSEVEEKVHDAVEAAMKAGGDESTKAAEAKKIEAAGGSSCNNDLKRKGEKEKGGVVKKAKGLWMGSGLDDLDDEDLSDSSDEETEKESSKTAVVAT